MPFHRQPCFEYLAPDVDAFPVAGDATHMAIDDEGNNLAVTLADRGELHLAILIETMRREGFELTDELREVIRRRIRANVMLTLTAANRKHDVIAVLITDPRELSMPGIGLVALRDAENGHTRAYDTGSAAFRHELERAAAQDSDGWDDQRPNPTAS